MPLMDGIVKGVPRNSHHPVVDGILSGIKKNLKPTLEPDMCKVKPSATKDQTATFGSGRTPQGKGNLK